MNSFAPSGGQVSIFDGIGPFSHHDGNPIPSAATSGASFSSSIFQQNTPVETADEAIERASEAEGLNEKTPPGSEIRGAFHVSVAEWFSAIA